MADAAPFTLNTALARTPDECASIRDGAVRALLLLPIAYQLEAIEALANGSDLSPLYAADDLSAAVDKARDEMEPAEREPVDPYWTRPLAVYANGAVW